MHGDAVPANFLASRGEDVVTVDWQCFGVGPVGSDLGYYALSSREEFDVLLDAFLAAWAPTPTARRSRCAARVTAVYSVVTRAEWALAQAARGEGALAGKFRHPAVAPHLRALQRQFPQIEALPDAELSADRSRRVKVPAHEAHEPAAPSSSPTAGRRRTAPGDRLRGELPR